MDADQDDYDGTIASIGVDTTLSGLEERRPLTLLQLPERGGDFSVSSSVSDLGSPIYERRSRQYIVSPTTAETKSNSSIWTPQHRFLSNYVVIKALLSATRLKENPVSWMIVLPLHYLHEWV